LVTLSTSRRTPRSRRACPTSVSDGSGSGFGFFMSRCLASSARTAIVTLPRLPNPLGVPVVYASHRLFIHIVTPPSVPLSQIPRVHLFPSPRRADDHQSTTARPVSSTTSPPVPSV
jgi:hypothetical protein